MAATLVNKNPESIQVLAVNTLASSTFWRRGHRDLHGRPGGQDRVRHRRGGQPEYVLNYLLTKNGVDPADVDIQWMTAQEVTAQMVSSEDGICMLPSPPPPP